jgi:hypothetical protein
MRVLPSLFVLLITVPLAGCFSVTAPKEIPDWAMSSQAESEQPRVRTTRRAAPPRIAEYPVTSDMPTNTGNVAMPTGDVPRTPPRRAVVTEQTPTAFSPEWHALEQAADDKLRRQMNICNGC